MKQARLKLSEASPFSASVLLSVPVSILDTQVRLGKDIDRIELGEGSIGESDEDINVPTKPTRHKWGAYKNVLLTDEEMLKLRDEFPVDWDERVERLSEYIASTGKKYKNHLATIRSWARKDTKPQGRPVANKSSNPFLDMLEDGYE